MLWWKFSVAKIFRLGHAVLFRRQMLELHIWLNVSTCRWSHSELSAWNSGKVELEIDDGFWQSSFPWVYSEYSSQWPNDWEKPSLLGFNLFNVIKPSGTGCLETWKRGHLLNRFHWQPLHLSSKNPLNSKVIHYLEIPWGMDEERHGGIWQSFQPSGHLASPEFIRKISHLDSENPKKNSNGLQKKNQQKYLI